MRFRFWHIALMLLLFACDKDEIGPQQVRQDSTGETGDGRKVWILSEGNFNWGNAGIDLYYPSGQQVNHGVFQAVNDQPLGDVGQSITSYRGFKLIVINNSGKMTMVDTADQELRKEITGMNSPRQAAVWQDKAFVTELYQDRVYMVDLLAGEVTSTIEVGGYTEYALANDGIIYIAEVDAGYVLMIDPVQEQVIDTLETGRGITGMVADAEGDIWVSFTGGNDSIPPAIEQLDPATGEVLSSLDIPGQQNPAHLTIDGDGSRICFDANGIYCLETSNPEISTSPFIDTADINVYAVSIDPHNGDIYFSDPLDYSQQSDIYRYSTSGEPIDQFKAGRIVGDFGF